MVRTEVELTYHTGAGYEHPKGHHLFTAMLRAMEHVENIYAVTDKFELKALTEFEYGIKIDSLGYLCNPSGDYTYRISFRDERHYLWFMLRWT